MDVRELALRANVTPLIDPDERAREFAAAVGQHGQAMSWLATRMAGVHAEDVVQEALLRAWRSWDQFDPRRGSLASWLLAITASEARRVSRRLRLPIRIGSSHTSERERDLDLERALNRLPPRQRLAVDCHGVPQPSPKPSTRHTESSSEPCHAREARSSTPALMPARRRWRETTREAEKMQGGSYAPEEDSIELGESQAARSRVKTRKP